MERLRGFGKYGFERRAHIRLQQVAAMGRSVVSPDDQMRMHHRFAALERDVPEVPRKVIQDPVARAVWEMRKSTTRSNGSKPKVRAIGARRFELALTS